MTKNLCIPTIIEKKGKYKPDAKVTKSKRGLYNKKLKLESVQESEEFESETITLMSTTLVSFVDAAAEDDEQEDEQQITLIVADVNNTHQYEDDIIIIKDENLLLSDEPELATSDTDKDQFSSYVNIESNSLACRLCPKIYKSIKVIVSHLKKEHKIEMNIDDELLKQVQDSLKPSKESNDPIIKSEESKSIPDQTQNVLKRSHMCLKCGRNFSSKTVLSDHERSDCGAKPVYVCDMCNKGYHSAGSLKTHKTMHTGELNHVCSYCGQTFRTAGQVKIHSRKHTGEKPYKCKKCQKSFGHRESLLTHESVHTGAKRFMCKCGQRFSCISNLKAHRKSHKDSCGKFPLITKPVLTEKKIFANILIND